MARFWFLIAIVIAGLSVEAKDLGVFGEIFEIEEVDLMEYIKAKLIKMEQSGELKKAQDEVVSHIKNRLTHPTAITGIGITEHVSERKFDPTIVVKKDIKTTDGVVFAKTGDQFNPLTKARMKPLLFIDGSNKKQVEWALRKMKDPNIFRHELSKIILVKGSPFELHEQLKMPIYFDQGGQLTTKFDIRNVPAMVFQVEGEIVLTVREEVLP